MKARRLWVGSFALLASALVCGLILTRRGRADEPQSPTVPLTNVAVIDMGRLYDQAGLGKAFDLNALQVMQEAEQRLKALESADYLQGAEVQEYVTLVGKVAPTDAETKRLQTLNETSQKRAQEFRTLQTKEPNALTAEEKRKMQMLFNLNRSYRERELPALIEQLRAITNAKTQTFRAEQMAQLRKTVGKFAKEKGIQHVFDSAVLIYTPNDITDKVVEKMKKP
jgi:Skp family chaperone for outer membrane proteins